MMGARGAPFAQGMAQGARFRRSIQTAAAALRRSYGWSGWWAATRRMGLGPGRRVQRHMPQHGERLDGIAAGARVSLRALRVAEAHERIRGVGIDSGERIGLCVDVPAWLGERMFLRRSVPEAGGFASAELTCAPWASALGGVNAKGLAVLCIADRSRLEPSMRFWVSELLLRGSDLDAAAEHLRRRARYAGGSGLLLLSAPGRSPLWLRLERGQLEVETPLTCSLQPARFTLNVEPGTRTVRWTNSQAHTQMCRPPEV